METIKLNGNGGIVVERVETPRAIVVPDLTEMLEFGLPMVGAGTFTDVMAKIDKSGLRPTTRQNLLLADMAQRNISQQYCQDIFSLFKNNYFWNATEGLSWKEGIFVYDNVDGKMPSTSEELAKLCMAKDKRVRHVEKGAKQGVLSIKDVLKHPFVIAHVGEDMIDTYGRLARALHQTEAFVGYVDSASSDTKRYSVLFSGRDSGRLGLDGNYDGTDRYGFASRVRKASAEGAKPMQKN
jgi:hypothetical protein